MNVRETAVNSRANGAANRKTVNRATKTTKTAVQIAATAVTSYLAGFFAGPAPKKARRNRRKS